MINIKEDYMIKIMSHQKITGQYDDCMEFTARGSYTEKDGVKYIIYREYTEGMPGNYNICMIKIEKDNKNITITKNGKVQSKLVFEKNKSHYSPYQTEYGMMSMSVYTHHIKSICDTNHGFVNIKYSMDLNTGVLSTMNILITYDKISDISEEILTNEEVQHVCS